MGTEKYREETETENIVNILENLIPQLEKEVATVETATPISKLMSTKVQPQAGIAEVESEVFEVATAPMPEDELTERQQRMKLETTRIMQEPEYKKLSGSTHKLQFLLSHLQTSEVLTKEDKAAVVSMNIYAKMPRSFTIGEIPALSVWHGDHCEFLVNYVGDATTSFSIQADPRPDGELWLKQTPGSDNRWHFRFTPVNNDKFPFTVTVTAVSDKQTVTQSFEITPMPKLPLEQIVFDTESHTQPGPVDFGKPAITDDVVEHTYYKDQKFKFNYLKPTVEKPLELRSIKIIGETVVFDENNKKCDLYVYDKNTDIQQLEILAEQVIIRSPLRLPQTHVVINAKTLRFEGSTAKIITTPNSLKTVPNPAQVTNEKDGSGKPGDNGEDGLPAGDITLNIEEFESDSTEIKFDLTGGKGQDGGQGKPGINGANMQGLDKYCMEPYKEYKAPAGTRIVSAEYQERSIFGIPIPVHLYGSKNWPGNGTHALSSGKPGEGGAGGTIFSFIDVREHVTNSGGLTGKIVMPKEGQRVYKDRKWYYKGGKAGNPQKAIWIALISAWFIPWWQVIGRHESEAGKDAEVGIPKKEQGDQGSYESEANPFTWLDPTLLNRLLNRAKNDYLNNRIEDADLRIEKYIEKLDSYKQSKQWNELNEMHSLELEQMYKEMQLLRHRIKNNLDYFGHPAGWTPLLSFEVNRKIFHDEVDRAADFLYYAYCIKNKASSAQQKFEALVSARNQMEKDNAAAVSDYNETISQISALRISAEKLKQQTSEFRLKLQAKELELTQRAQEKLSPSWLIPFRLGLKVLGTLVSVIPVYQPVTGTVGSVMTLVSDVDINKPWESIFELPDIAAEFCSSQFDEETKTLKNIMDDKKIGEAFDHKFGVTKDNKNNKEKAEKAKKNLQTKIDYLGRGKKSFAALSTGLNDIANFREKYSAPQAEVDAELEKLKAQSKEYIELVNEIKALHEKYKSFADNLAAAMQKVSLLFNHINNNILAIDAMNLELPLVQAGLNKRVSAYVDDMERRAYDRLIEYHYYLAKAYEYRILEPYTQPLDFKQLIKEVEKIAKVKAWEELDSETFKLNYSTAYNDMLAKIARKIFHDYNTKAVERTNNFGYLLSEEELAQLNAGNTIEVNFARYLPNKENIRIVDIGIQMYDKRKGDITTTAAGSEYPRNAYLDLTFSHPSISRIRSRGNLYQFHHPFIKDQNPLVWGSHYDPESDLVTPITPSAASDSMLKSLLEEGASSSDMMLYSRPSVWTNLQITKSGYPKNGSDISIKRLKLELTYDYFKSAHSLVNKHILVTAIEPGEGESFKVLETNFEPYFIVDTEDKNKRQDARGSFLRMYQYKLNAKISITAQPSYGNYIFNKWTDVDGDKLPNADGTHISLDLKNDQFICAQYIRSEAMTKKVLKIASAIPHATEFETIKAKESELA